MGCSGYTDKVSGAPGVAVWNMIRSVFEQEDEQEQAAERGAGLGAQNMRDMGCDV